MQRRTYLGATGVATLASLAGCLTGLLEDQPEGVVLGPPDEQAADSVDLAYPAYGESLEPFELEDPLAGTTIDTADLDRTALITTFFAYCPAECGVLINRLSDVHDMTTDAGLVDDTVFLAITFDPERDDAETLAENAETNTVDLDAGNWHYLRPDSEAEAESVVTGKIGLEYERVEDSERISDGYDFNHIVITHLVNPDGVVERAYRGENLNPQQLLEDVEAVVEGS